MNKKNKRIKYLIIMGGSLIFIVIILIWQFVFNQGIIPFNIEKLTHKTVTSGDGLYKDGEKYIYKGKSPNNYLQINNELWRIISIEKNGELKIVKQNALEKSLEVPFDEASTRTTSYCGITNNGMFGCNAWAQNLNYNNGKYYDGHNPVIKLNGEVSADSTLNTYLNTEYYNNLPKYFQNIIVNHTWNIGGITGSSKNFNKQIKEEEKITWQGKVSLLNVSDIIKASSSSKCTSLSNFNKRSLNCSSSNYLISKNNYWLLNPTLNTGNIYTVTRKSITASIPSNFFDIKPAVYLSKNITLTGKGTKDNPYKLENEPQKDKSKTKKNTQKNIKNTLTEINYQQYENLYNSDQKFILIISSKTCSYCEKIESTINEYNQDQKFVINKINLDNIKKSEINSIISSLSYFAEHPDWDMPIILIIQNKQVINSYQGYTTDEDIKNFLNQNG